MRLKIRKLLSGGSYFVSFEVIGFNSAESEKIEIRGMPAVDLSGLGLGAPRLDQLNFKVRCHSAQEAEQLIRTAKRRIKRKLRMLLRRRESLNFHRVIGTLRRQRVMTLGLACAFVFLLLTAYKGVISSQRPIDREKITVGPTPKEAIAHDRTKGASSEDLFSRSERDSDVQRVVQFVGRASSANPGGGARDLSRPDFHLTVVPEVLARYSSWGSDAEPSREQDFKHFKLIVTPVGGLKGPITLGVSTPSPLLNLRLYPGQIEKLPGSATLMVSVPSRSVPQILPDITVVARGRGPDGSLITHERNLSLMIRQSSSYDGPVWHVSPQGSDQSGDGSCGSPFRSIQLAIDAADSGDTVLVESGLYLENVRLEHKKGLLVTSRYVFDQNESTIRSTVIEALNSGWVVTVGRSNDVTLQGFTVQKGKGRNGTLGGGIYAYNSRVNILDNVITDNQNTSGYGAGIYCYESQPTVLRNRITGNSNGDGQGAGIYCYKSDPQIEENTIAGNHSSGGGSAIHLLEPTSAKVIRNVIHDQSGPSAVVLYNEGDVREFQISNNTVSHNHGDAVRFFGGQWSLESNIVTDNEGYGIFTLRGTAYLSHNDVWNNVRGDDTLNYHGLEASLTGSSGNISADPHFGNPTHGNFRLCFDSPCINSGKPGSSVPSGGGQRVDMGAFEYTLGEMICGDVNRDGLMDYGDITCLAGHLSGRLTAPVPLQVADVNRDDVIDKNDLAHLYESLYYYGPEPCGQRKPKDRLTSK